MMYVYVRLNFCKSTFIFARMEEIVQKNAGDGVPFKKNQ